MEILLDIVIENVAVKSNEPKSFKSFELKNSVCLKAWQDQESYTRRQTYRSITRDLFKEFLLSRTLYSSAETREKNQRHDHVLRFSLECID